MLTDDEITTRLSRGYEQETRGLEYAGRVPRPRTRRIAPYAVSLALPAAAAAALAVAALHGATPAGDVPTVAVPSPTVAPIKVPSVHPHVRLVTETFRIAGHTVTYRHPAGQKAAFGGECDPDQPLPTGDPGQQDCYVALEALVKAVPSDATPVDIPGLEGAQVGIDPATGDAALFVASKDGSRVYAVLSSKRSQAQLIELVRSMSAK